MDKHTVSRVRKLVGASDAYRRAASRAIGVSVIELQALSDLSYFGSMTPSSLAARLGLASPSMTALVDRLEQAGFVERIRNPRDRRSVLVVLTEVGSTSYKSIHEYYVDAISICVEGVAPESIDEVERFLDRVTEALRARTDEWSNSQALLDNSTMRVERRDRSIPGTSA